MMILQHLGVTHTIPRYNTNCLRRVLLSDLTVRPTAKFLIARFIATGVVFVAIEIWYALSLRDKGVPAFFPIAAVIIFVPVVMRVIRRQLTAVTVSGDRLRYEAGAFSKTTRTMQ